MVELEGSIYHSWRGSLITRTGACILNYREPSRPTATEFESCQVDGIYKRRMTEYPKLEVALANVLSAVYEIADLKSTILRPRKVLELPQNIQGEK